MRALLALMLLVVGACSTAPADVDQAGNAYPVGCSAAELTTVPAEIVFMDPVILAGLDHTNGTRELGVWLPAPSAEDDIIWIDNTLTGWKRDDAVRHERCHSKLFHATGNGQWHR